MSVKVDKNIAMPPAPGSGRGAKYPWVTMKIGESFAIAAPAINNARVTASSASTRYGKKFVARQLPNGEFRIWRIE